MTQDPVAPSARAQAGWGRVASRPFLPGFGSPKPPVRVRGHTTSPRSACLTPESFGPSESAATIETTHVRTAVGRGEQSKRTARGAVARVIVGGVSGAVRLSQRRLGTGDSVRAGQLLKPRGWRNSCGDGA